MERSTGRWASVLRTPLGATGAFLIVFFVSMAIVAPLIWSEDASRIDLGADSASHILGTDSLGRDIFYRVLVASRLSIGMTLLATMLGLALGIVFGAAPSILGRRAGRAITAAINLAVAFPGLLVVLVFAVIFGVGMNGAVLAVGLAMAPSFARLTQTLAASVEGRDYVAAARAAGVGRARLLVRHILPNIAEPLAVNATIGAGGALLTFSGLSFLGIGVQPPSYDWGRLLGEGLNRIYLDPAAALAPGVAVVLAGLGFSMFGEMAAKVLGGTAIQQNTRRGAKRPASGSSPGRANGPTPADPDELLLVENLWLEVLTDNGWVTPVRGVSFSLRQGEAVGLVGESGSGKSLTAMAVAGLTEPPVQVTADRLEFQGRSVLSQTRTDRKHLGTSLAMVFQDPMASLNPSMRVGRQLAEISEVHHNMSRREAMERAVSRISTVRIPEARRRARQHPHEYSGGMRQRAVIAMGLMGSPRLVVADEPTTALDARVQQQILQLFEQVRSMEGAAILLISHDLAVVGQVCDRILVMYAGRIVEDLPQRDLMADARHPYTRALLSAVPHLDHDVDAPLAVIEGSPPDPADVPSGCAFAARCQFATARCTEEQPELSTATPVDTRHRVACWHPQDQPLDLSRSTT